MTGEFALYNQPRTAMNPNYKPYEERTPDTQYRDMLIRILREGVETRNPHQEVGTIAHFSLSPLVYRFSNGFPIIPDRDIKFWKVPINELGAFMNGVRTLDGLHAMNVKFWDQWATPEKCARFGLPPGDLGPASYGAAYHDYPHFEWEDVEDHPDGGRWIPKPFNQFEHVLREAMEMPGLRTHMLTSWIPSGCMQHSRLKRGVVVAPCHGSLIKLNIFHGKLTLQHAQRSADVPIGIVSNIIQYAALTLWIAEILNLEAYEYVHWPLDAQIYTNQVEKVKELIEREPLRLPTLIPNNRIELDPSDLFALRGTCFDRDDYHPHPHMDIPVVE